MITPFLLKRAATACHRGGIIAYPTEGVYGLGCDPLNPYAVEHLLALKNRTMGKGLILLAANMDQLMPYIQPDKKQIDKITKTQTATTWLVKKSTQTPFWICGDHDKVAVRLCRHRDAVDLCNTIGYAIVSTSANPAGSPPAANRLMVRKYFGAEIDFILPGQVGGLHKPTQIRDIENDRLVRAG